MRGFVNILNQMQEKESKRTNTHYLIVKSTEIDLLIEESRREDL